MAASSEDNVAEPPSGKQGSHSSPLKARMRGVHVWMLFCVRALGRKLSLAKVRDNFDIWAERAANVFTILTFFTAIWVFSSGQGETYSTRLDLPSERTKSERAARANPKPDGTVATNTEQRSMQFNTARRRVSLRTLTMINPHHGIPTIRELKLRRSYVMELDLPAPLKQMVKMEIVENKWKKNIKINMLSNKPSGVTEVPQSPSEPVSNSSEKHRVVVKLKRTLLDDLGDTLKPPLKSATGFVFGSSSPASNPQQLSKPDSDQAIMRLASGKNAQ